MRASARAGSPALVTPSWPVKRLGRAWVSQLERARRNQQVVAAATGAAIGGQRVSRAQSARSSGGSAWRVRSAAAPLVYSELARAQRAQQCSIRHVARQHLLRRRGVRRIARASHKLQGCRCAPALHLATGRTPSGMSTHRLQLSQQHLPQRRHRNRGACFRFPQLQRRGLKEVRPRREAAAIPRRRPRGRRWRRGRLRGWLRGRLSGRLRGLRLLWRKLGGRKALYCVSTVAGGPMARRARARTSASGGDASASAMRG